MGAVLRVCVEGREHERGDKERVRERRTLMVVTELTVQAVNAALVSVQKTADNAVGALKSRVSALETKIAALESTVAALKEKVNG